MIRGQVEEQGAAWAQTPREFVHRVEFIVYGTVAEHVARKHDVEATVVERQRVHTRNRRAREVTLAAEVHGLRGEIDTDGAGRRGEQREVRAGSASRVQ